MSQPPSQPPKVPRELPPRVIEDMVRQQAQQLELRNRELSLKEKDLDRQAGYAEKVLAAQADDLKDQRRHESKQTRTKIIGAVIVFVLILAFLAICILKGHETIALEIVKAVVYLAAGGSGGYAYGRTRKRTKSEDEEDDSEQE
jgi:hypothetical protein